MHTIGPVRPGTIDRRRQLWLDASAEIERRYAEPLTVADVARSIGTSTRQLQRVFDEVGERSFRAHLAAVRMDRAREMLLDHGGTVRAVAAPPLRRSHISLGPLAPPCACACLSKVERLTRPNSPLGVLRVGK